jgi:exopolysaccharide biosynthesis polyprenyl glycosylphosphotransferase
MLTAPPEEAIDLRETDERSVPVRLHPVHENYNGHFQPTSNVSSRKTALVLADLTAIAVALIASVVIHGRLNPGDPVTNSTYFVLLLTTAVVWPAMFMNQSLYKARFITRGVDEGWRILKAIGGSLILIGVASIMAKITLARTWIITVTIITVLLVAFERYIARVAFRRSRLRGNMLRRVLIIGRNAEGLLVRDMLASDPVLGYEVVGFAESLLPPSDRPINERLGEPSAMLGLLEETGAVGVIIAATAVDIETSNQLIRTLTENGVHVELSSTLCDIATDRLSIRPLGRFPMVYIEPVRRHGWRALAKRSFDLIVSLILMVFTSLLMGPAMLAVKLTSPGPVFFKQVRVGRDGKEFEVYKLRTMVVDAEDQLDNVKHLNEAEGPLFKIKDDPRITPVGRVLRKTSIDELPQLINVVRGEMALVGPRPALPSEVKDWDESLHNRLRVRPGITGMWQVSGRSDAGGDYGQLDLFYVDNWTLFTDVMILIRTVPAVVMQRGSY